jgi:hypothetical protein
MVNIGRYWHRMKLSCYMELRAGGNNLSDIINTMYHKNKIHSKAIQTNVMQCIITTLPCCYYSRDPNEVQLFTCFLIRSHYLVTLYP